jgi:hypothetical protein
MSIIGLTTKVKDVVDGLSKVKAAGEQKREIVENSRLEINRCISLEDGGSNRARRVQGKLLAEISQG